MRLPTLEDKANQVANLLEDTFEEELFPKIVFVHEDLTKHKELLKSLYFKGATAGQSILAKELEDEEIHNKILPN